MGTTLSIAADKNRDKTDGEPPSFLDISIASVQKLIKAVTDVLISPTYFMTDDGWYEQAVGRIDEMDEVFELLHTATKGLTNDRRYLSVKESELSKSLLALASRDNDASMMHITTKLAEAHDNVSIAEYHKAEMIAYQLESPLKEQLRTTQELKRVFEERVTKWKEWQSLLQSTIKKRDTEMRLELTGRGLSDRAAQLRKEIKDEEEKAAVMESDFLTIGEVIRGEYARYFKQRREDIKKAIILYLELLIENEGRVLSYWETFGNEMTSGGN